VTNPRLRDILKLAPLEKAVEHQAPNSEEPPAIRLEEDDSKPDAFDPYNEWLGIPPEDQPPHHYQLLGIDLFEGDGGKIAHAALSRTETLRTYQLGSHFEASQQLLNQVAQAKLCLLDAERKTAYDAALKQRLSPAEAPAQQNSNENE
jgi:hypothetical protein